MATQTVGRGLSPADLTRIRETLAAGRRPKVVFTAAAGQMAGQVGQVVELTDPAGSDEWVVVRVGRDELPFSPADLAVPPKAPARRPAQAAAGAPAAVPGQQRPAQDAAPATIVDQPKESVMPSTPARSAPARAAAAEPAPAKVPVDARPAEARANGSKAAAPVDAPVAGAAKTAPRKAAKSKASPTLTVTVTYADGEWLVGAIQGTRVLAKPYVIRPAEALRMVALLDVPGVHEAVDDIVSAARDEAQRQAERLRAELAEVESRLAELREAP